MPVRVFWKDSLSQPVGPGTENGSGRLVGCFGFKEMPMLKLINIEMDFCSFLSSWLFTRKEKKYINNRYVFHSITNLN